MVVVRVERGGSRGKVALAKFRKKVFVCSLVSISFSLSLSLAVSPPLFLFALFSLLFFVFFGGIDLLLGGAVVSTGVGVGVGRETDDQIFPIQDGVGVGGRRNGGEEEEG